MAGPRKRTPRIPDYCKSVGELAKVLGISRTTLTDARKEPNFPLEVSGKGYKVDDVLRFIKKRATQKSTIGDRGNGDILELRMRQLAAQCAKIEHEVAVGRNRYILRETWQIEVTEIISAFDNSFQKNLEQELPSQLEGQPAIVIRDRLREAYNEMRKEINEKLRAIGE